MPWMLWESEGTARPVQLSPRLVSKKRPVRRSLQDGSVKVDMRLALWGPDRPAKGQCRVDRKGINLGGQKGPDNAPTSEDCLIILSFLGYKMRHTQNLLLKSKN